MSEAPKILIVEDDEQIAGMVRDSLNEQGMLVEVASDGVAMDAKMRALEFDLVVLDVMLPGEDGFSICRRLRGSGDIPILMLTSVSSDIDRVVGLEIGADDYVTKPFVLRELTARIKGLLRRSRVTSQRPDSLRKSFFRFDGWQVDPARRQLHDPSHARVAMTTHEFDLLLAFCQNPGRVLTREQLLSATHAGLAGPIERSIDVHMSRLRQIIETVPRDPTRLKT
ncbi:response regulator transcription factor, partial [Agrobacterium vitis]|uniref:response regulator transcription factor n=1 Tax=Agrobacterium vitis TaxID=373 RepID=UPI00203526AB